MVSVFQQIVTINVRVLYDKVLIDIDECSNNSHDCSANAICTNNEGSYTCLCIDGYSGDGKTCNGKDKL